MISYFFFNYIHIILIHCHSTCFCNQHPINLLLHCFLCIFINFIFTSLLNLIPNHSTSLQFHHESCFLKVVLRKSRLHHLSIFPDSTHWNQFRFRAQPDALKFEKRKTSANITSAKVYFSQHFTNLGLIYFSLL